MKKTTLFEAGKEIYFGFLMAIATFGILPLSIEMAGVITAFLGILVGVCIVSLIKHFFHPNRFFWMLFCSGILFGIYLFRFPFRSYFENGIFYASVSGVLLSIQIIDLSLPKTKATASKKIGMLYLLGLILGILLK